MDVTVVYESLFGNTRAIAEAIAAGARQADPAASVRLIPVAEASHAGIGEPGLLIVGGPTHAMRMTSQRTRRAGLRATDEAPHDNEPGAEGPGVRDFLKTLPPPRPGSRAAAFDTRLAYPQAGGAAHSISRHLRRHGYQLTAKPQGFVVKGTYGPLREGEWERARAWGATLAGQLASGRN